jgi:hypothetical protein
MPRGGLAPQINPGEGAFYGPKLEFALRDRLGRNRRGDTYKAKRQHIFVRVSPCFCTHRPRYRLNDATNGDNPCDHLSC